MAIITIARERGAFGRTTAKQLADSLGAHLIDREVVDARLEAIGIAESKRNAFDERKPGFFAVLTNAIEEYVCSLKQVLYEEAQCGNCVILGRGSQILFKDIPGVVRVRLVAPMDIRCQRVSDAEHISLREAKSLIERVDHDRSGFNSYFFDTDWHDPKEYQMVLNTEHLTPELVISIIKDIVKEVETPELMEQAKKMLQNRAKAQCVEREILHTQHIPIFFLKATCEGNHITLTGMAHSTDAIEQAQHAAKSVPGIETVQCHIEIGIHGQYDSVDVRRM